MRLGASTYSTQTFLSIEVNANAADVPGKMQTIHECDGSGFQFLIVGRCIHSSHLLCALLSAGAYALRASSKRRIHASKLCAMSVAASSWEMRLAATSTRGCQKLVRPTANPMNPGTLAAVFSQRTTRSRSAPRPSTQERECDTKSC